jgi:hypothetical protein
MSPQPRSPPSTRHARTRHPAPRTPHPAPRTPHPPRTPPGQPHPTRILMSSAHTPHHNSSRFAKRGPAQATFPTCHAGMIQPHRPQAKPHPTPKLDEIRTHATPQLIKIRDAGDQPQATFPTCRAVRLPSRVVWKSADDAGVTAARGPTQATSRVRRADGTGLTASARPRPGDISGLSDQGGRARGRLVCASSAAAGAPTPGAASVDQRRGWGGARKALARAGSRVWPCVAAGVAVKPRGLFARRTG